MRLARRLLHALVIVLTLCIGAAAAVIIVAETAWFKNLLRAYIVREANQYLNGQMTIDRVGGNLFFGVELENIAVSMDGSQVVAIKDLGLDYNVFELISKGLSLNSIRLNEPVIYLRREGDTWSISRLVKKQQQEAERQGPGRPIAIEAIGISDGSFVVESPVGTSGVEVPKRVDHLDAKMAFKYEPVRYTIQISHVSFRGVEPSVGLNALSGVISVRNDAVYVDKLALRTEESSLSVDGAVQQYLTNPVFNLRLSSDKVSLPEIARLVPALAGVKLQPAFRVAVEGSMDRLAVTLGVESSAGRIDAKVHGNLVAPGQAVQGDVSIRHLDLGPVLPRTGAPAGRPLATDITADAHVDVRSRAFSDLDSLRGTVRLDAPQVKAAGYVVDRLKAGARLNGRHVGIDARASAYGASASASGVVTLPAGPERGGNPRPVILDALAYDIRGQARQINLKRLPPDLKLPPAATDINLDYHVLASSPESIQAKARFEDTRLPGAAIAAGSTVNLSLESSQQPSHGRTVGRGETARATSGTAGYQMDATVMDVNLQELGRAFRVDALDAERFKSSINAHVTAAGHLPTGSQSPALGAMDLTANGSLNDSTVLGGRIPSLTFDASVARDTVQIRAAASLADVDPAMATGRADLKGTVGWTADLDVTARGLSEGINPDNLEGNVRVGLQASTIGEFAIQRASLDASYRESAGEIRTLEVVGPDVNVRATGTLALNETGQSNLQMHADTPSLERVGKLLGQSLAGIAKLDATLTGNRTELRVAGNLTGDGLEYGGNGALALSSNFQARLPGLQPSDASISATTNGTFVKLGGLQINELSAKTDYAGNQLDFDLTAKQPQRSLGAAGRLTFVSGAGPVRETDVAGEPANDSTSDTANDAASALTVVLNRLTIQTQAVTWQLAPGAHPVIEYNSAPGTAASGAAPTAPGAAPTAPGTAPTAPGTAPGTRHPAQHVARSTQHPAPAPPDLPGPPDRPPSDALRPVIVVRDLRLANGDQQIAAQGTFGRPDERLEITLNRIELAGIDALMLRPPQLSGRLSASSTVAGSTDVPEAHARFQVDQGGFRQFRYDALTGTVDYRASGVTLDTRLQQSPTAWITAKGYVPAAAWKPPASTGPGGHHEAASPEEAIDLHIDSSPIDLGVVQGLTTAVTNVKGTVHAKIDVTGAADDPHPSGSVTVQGASLGVVASGVNYTDLEGRIDFEPDRVHIDHITVLDNQRKPLSIAGDLAVHERAIGAFNLTLGADDFKVIDNKMGNVRIRSDLRLSGALRQPRLEGNLGVVTGVINLDPILSAFGGSPYSTREIQYQNESAAPGSSAFDAVQIDLHLTVPDDLVVRGNDLRPNPDSPVSLGTLNVTLGGDVRVAKEIDDTIRLYGPIRTIRGTYEFQGRKFNILRDGTVRFEGLDQIDPALDVKTSQVIQGVEADVNIRGSLLAPEIALSSKPPLPEADILGLIVFGQPVQQLGEGQQISLAQRAQSLAMGAAAGQLARSIGNALNLNTFEIQAGAEGAPGAQVTVGQQVGQNLYVKLQQGLGDVSTTNVIVEYELAKWLRLQTNLLQGASTQQALFQRAQGSGFDLIFLFSY